MSSAADWNDERRRAGRALALRLEFLRDASPIVVGLPRGGIPAAYEVARELDAPLEVCVVAKVSDPRQPRITIGAVGEGGALYVDDGLVAKHRIADDVLADLLRTKRAEVDEQVHRFRGEDCASAPILGDRTVVLVDDVIVSGASARAALRVLRARGARRVVLATPIGNATAVEQLRSIADEVVCLVTSPKAFRLDNVYVTPTSRNEVEDEDVIDLVSRVRTARKQRYSEVWSPWQ